MYQRILVPVDGSTNAKRALQEAIKLANDTAELRLVYVVEESHSLDPIGYGAIDYAALLEAVRQTGKRTLAEAMGVVQKSGKTADTSLLEANGERISTMIGSAAKNWKADLIVIGTHGRSGLNRFLLGSVAEDVARSATVPVLLVHADPGSAGH